MAPKISAPNGLFGLVKWPLSYALSVRGSRLPDSLRFYRTRSGFKTRQDRARRDKTKQEKQDKSSGFIERAQVLRQDETGQDAIRQDKTN